MQAPARSVVTATPGAGASTGAGIAAARLRLADLIALAKPRITTMVVLTAALGLALAPRHVAALTAIWTLAGTALIVAGANALNMWAERDVDGRMARTANRPLPAGRLEPGVAIVWGSALAALSLPVLALGVGPLACALAVTAFVVYVGLYTPWKRRSWTSLWVGAVAGALPPVIGWAAATGAVGLPAALLFGILFFWQLPHFTAIAFYRADDYRNAGLHTVPTTRGPVAGKRHLVVYTAALVAVTLLPALLGEAGRAYLVAAGALGALLLGLAISGVAARTPEAYTRWAQRYFVATLPYLALVLCAWLADSRLHP